MPLTSTPQRCFAVLCNPLAGVGLATRLSHRLSEELKRRSLAFSVFSGEWPPDLAGFTDIWLIGGDGTLNFFVNHYPIPSIPLTVFNGGTGNDFHWLLYGNLSLEQMIEKGINGRLHYFDVGKCNGDHFMNGVGIGFEGAVAKALTGKKKMPGKTSFLLTVLRKIFSYRSRNYSVSIPELNMNNKASKSLFIDVANGARAGGGFHVAPESKADDGLLDVIICDALAPLNRLRYLPIIEKGKHLQLPFVQHLRTTNMLIESSTLIQYHLDGEYKEAVRLEISLAAAAMIFRI